MGGNLFSPTELGKRTIFEFFSQGKLGLEIDDEFDKLVDLFARLLSSVNLHFSAYFCYIRTKYFYFHLIGSFITADCKSVRYKLNN